MRCKSSHWSGAAVAASSSAGGSRARGTYPHGLAAAVARGDGSFSLLPTVGSLSRHPPSAPERPRKVAAGRECDSVRCDMQRHQREPGEHEGRMIDAETTVALGSPGGCQPCRPRAGRGRDTRPVPHQADHADRAVPGRRDRRPPVPGHCRERIQASRPAGDHRQQAGRQRHARAGRRWPPPPSPTATPSGRSRSPCSASPTCRRRPSIRSRTSPTSSSSGGYSLGTVVQGRRPVQEMEGRHRVRQGQSRQVHLRHDRPGHHQRHRHGADGAPVGRAVHPHPDQGRRRSRSRQSSAGTSWRWWNRRPGRRWWPPASSACS